MNTIMNGVEFKKLYVKNGKILKNDVEEISQALNLSCMNIYKIENLPNKIMGSLYLNNNNITKIENLPKLVNGYIVLDKNPISKYTRTDSLFLEITFNDKSFDSSDYRQFVRQYLVDAVLNRI